MTHEYLNRPLLVDLALNGPPIERAAALALLDENEELLDIVKQRVMEVMQTEPPTHTRTTSRHSNPPAPSHSKRAVSHAKEAL